MKKLTGFLLVALLCALVVPFTACFGIPDPPEISVTGNVLHWNAVEDAEGYVVYIGGVSAETTKTYYVAENVTETATAYVTAKKGDKFSKNSNEVTVNKNVGFSESECMYIDFDCEANSETQTEGEAGGENAQPGVKEAYTVMSDINYVKVSGTAANTCLQIQNRVRDLVVELDKVTLNAADGKSCIGTMDGKYDAGQSNFTVIFIVKGENSLYGGDCTAVPQQPSKNSGKTGATGGEGGSGIVLPNAVFTGKGTLSLYGGKGGEGGKGASSDTWSTSSNGNGGNGGKGGSGLKTTNFTMAMEVEGILRTYAGEGGKGGRVGDNGSLITGPWVSIAGSRTSGKDGGAGSKYLGTLLELGGSLS